MYVSDEEVSDKNGWLSVPLHDDKSNQHDHDGANLDQPCGQRDCVPGVGSCLARDTSCASDAGDPGPHQRGIAPEDSERCHTDQRCAPREGARGESHLRFPAREQTFVTSPMRHPRPSRKRGPLPATSSRSASSSPRRRETQADNRTISIHVHSTAPRHPVVSTSNVESVEVGEDASELSCPRRSSPSTSSRNSQRRGGCSHRTLLRKSLHRLYIRISQLSYSPSRRKERRVRGSAERVLLQWEKGQTFDNPRQSDSSTRTQNSSQISVAPYSVWNPIGPRVKKQPQQL